MTVKDWMENKRKFAAVGAIIFWCISVVFNVYGFSFSNDTTWAWMVGLAMSIGITIIQLVGNSVKKMDTTFTYVWWLSYIYGIGANVYGILNFMGVDTSIYYKWIIAVPMGVMIEIVPERLLLLSIDGLGDNIRSLIPAKQPTKPIRPAYTKPAEKYVPKYRPTYTSPSSGISPSRLNSYLPKNRFTDDD